MLLKKSQAIHKKISGIVTIFWWTIMSKYFINSTFGLPSDLNFLSLALQRILRNMKNLKKKDRLNNQWLILKGWNLGMRIHLNCLVNSCLPWNLIILLLIFRYSLIQRSWKRNWNQKIIYWYLKRFFKNETLSVNKKLKTSFQTTTLNPLKINSSKNQSLLKELFSNNQRIILDQNLKF